MATIRDVAREAGVSTATVSRALRDLPSVSLPTREHVANVARSLGYRCNRLAKGLVESRTHSLGLVLPEPGGNPYYGRVTAAARARARQLGYETFILHFSYDPEDFIATMQHMEERQADGIVFTALPEYALAYSAQGLAPACPIVSLHDMTAPSDPSVPGFDWQAARLGTEHLLSLGHRDIAYLGSGPLPAPASREAGYRAAMLQAGLEPKLVECIGWLGGGLEGMEDVLRMSPVPTAVVAFNDVTALGALRALYEAHVNVPEEMSVVGYDNIEIGAYTAPALTTVDGKADAVAARAVDRLVSLIEGGDAPDAPGPLLPELVVRATSGPPPCSSARPARAAWPPA